MWNDEEIIIEDDEIREQIIEEMERIPTKEDLEKRDYYRNLLRKVRDS